MGIKGLREPKRRGKKHGHCLGRSFNWTTLKRETNLFIDKFYKSLIWLVKIGKEVKYKRMGSFTGWGDGNHRLNINRILTVVIFKAGPLLYLAAAEDFQVNILSLDYHSASIGIPENLENFMVIPVIKDDGLIGRSGDQGIPRLFG